MVQARRRWWQAQAMAWCRLRGRFRTDAALAAAASAALTPSGKTHAILDQLQGVSQLTSDRWPARGHGSCAEGTLLWGMTGTAWLSRCPRDAKRHSAHIESRVPEPVLLGRPAGCVALTNTIRGGAR